MNTLKDFAKSVFAHISAKFKYSRNNLYRRSHFAKITHKVAKSKYFFDI